MNHNEENLDLEAIKKNVDEMTKDIPVIARKKK